MHTIMSIESSGTSGWSTKYCEPIIEDRKFGGSSASNAAKRTPRAGRAPFRPRAASMRMATAAALSSAPR